MENKPVCEIDDEGNKSWRLNGMFHREDGPAIEYYHGPKIWFKYGDYHRLDGPAIIRWDGSFLWFINDNDVTDEITNWAKDNDIDLDNLTNVDKVLIKLVWADYGK